MTWFNDRNGTTFTTPDGKTPGAYGVAVTIANNGQLTTGTWQNGTAVPNK